MARVKGPLFSMSASGALGGAIVFGSWKGRPVVRELVIPANPKTAPQLSRRAMLKFLSQSWALIVAADKASWNSRAQSQAISPFNAYCQYNLDKWTQGLWPTTNTVPLTDVTATLGAQTLTGGVGQITISQAISTIGSMWGMAQLLSASTITTFDTTKVRVITQILGGASPFTSVITGLTPGTWWVRGYGFYISANTVGNVASASVVVT